MCLLLKNDFDQTLGRELQWEKVQNMMKPAAQGLPVTAGILASAVIVMIKSRQWSLALELQQVQSGGGIRSMVLHRMLSSRMI